MSKNQDPDPELKEIIDFLEMAHVLSKMHSGLQEGCLVVVEQPIFLSPN